MTQLSVNVNKIAVLRNSRGGTDPDVLQAARACLDAGAHGITVHPRPDRRHIHAEDVLALSALTTARGVEFNIEGNPFAPPREGYPGLLPLCAQTRPAQATLVPDGDGQLTSDHGFDFGRDAERLRPLIAELKSHGCRSACSWMPATRTSPRPRRSVPIASSSIPALTPKRMRPAMLRPCWPCSPTPLAARRPPDWA